MTVLNRLRAFARALRCSAFVPRCPGLERPTLHRTRFAARILLLALVFVPGAVLAVDNVSAPDITGCVSSSDTLEPGTTPVFPGRWWNPERNGTGWDLRFLDDGRLAVLWYTFDRERRPVWLLSDLAEVDRSSNTASAVLRKYTWDWPNEARHAEAVRVGSVAVAFSDADPSRAAISWQWDEVGAAAHEECIRDFSRLGPSIQGANTAFSGEWYEPAHSGWSASMTIVPLREAGTFTGYGESGVVSIYDDAGQPVWLEIGIQSTDAVPALGEAVAFELSYVTSNFTDGVPITECRELSCVNRAPEAGTFTRTYLTTSSMQSVLDVDVAAAVQQFDRPPIDPDDPEAIRSPVSLVRLTAIDQVLVDRVDCTVPAGQSTCAVQVDWSANSHHPEPTVFRFNLESRTFQEIGRGRHGEVLDHLSAGARVQYELHDTTVRDTSPVYVTHEVRAYGSTLSDIDVDRTACTIPDASTCAVLVDWQTDPRDYPSASVFRLDLVTGNHHFIDAATQGQWSDPVPAGSHVRYELRADNLAGSELLAASPDVRVRVDPHLDLQSGTCTIAAGDSCEVQSSWAVDPIDYPDAALFLRNMDDSSITLVIAATRGMRFADLGVGRYRYEVHATSDPSSTSIVVSDEIAVVEQVDLPPLVDLPDIAQCTAADLPVRAAGTMAGFPGTWWNPGRYGTGWNLIFHDDETLSVFWFTFDADRHPVWLKTEPAAVDVQILEEGARRYSYQAYLREYRWQNGVMDAGTVVGSVALALAGSDPTRAAVRWQWDGVGPAAQEPECIKDYVRPAPTPELQDVNMAFTGEWHESGTGSWPDYSLLLAVLPTADRTYVESATLAIFDDSGRATWLLSDPLTHAQRPALGVLAEANLNYVTPTQAYPSGTPTTFCDGGQCIQTVPAGDYTRTFESGETMRGRIVPSRSDLTGFHRPPGAGTVLFVKKSAENLVLVDRVDCTVPIGADTCPIRVEWSAAATYPGATLFRRDLPFDTAVRRGTGTTGAVVDALEAGDRVQYELRVGDSPGDTLLFETVEIRGYGSEPLVRIDFPLTDAEYDEPAAFTISAVATDPDQAITKVEFLLNGQPAGCASPTQPPYTCAVTGLDEGQYTIEARATNAEGAASLSDPVAVRVNHVPVPPVVRITAPSDGSTAEAPAQFVITATIEDDTLLDFIVFFANGQPIHEIASPSGVAPGEHTFRWQNVGEGTYDIVVRARDQEQLSGASSVRVTVVPKPPVDLPAPDTASDRVGATAGQFRVDESGAATYSIPLYASHGTAGVVPQMALSYSSQGGNGPLGKGWSLQGSSSIVRCRRTREAGDATGTGLPPVEFGPEDAFCMDGQRLLEVADGAVSYPRCAVHPGAVARQFRTEIESFQRVCAYTIVQAHGPRYFTVERKDGSTSWYGDRRSAMPGSSSGDAPDGFVGANGPGQEGRIFLWAQTRFQDSTGNYIDYRYLKDPGGEDRPGEHLLSEVAYTGKLVLPGQDGPALGPYASLRFEYAELAQHRHSVAYVSGSQFWRTRRLTGIHSSSGATTLRYYALDYDTAGSGSDAALLGSVTECRDATRAVCLEPTIFAWSTASHAFATEQRTEQIENGSLAKFEGLKFGDIDGDGLQDMVWVKDGTNDDRDCKTDVIHVAFGELSNRGIPGFHLRGRQFCAESELENHDDEPDEETGSGNDAVRKPDSSWFLLDYTGDGKDDLFLRTNAGWKGFASIGLPRGNQNVFDRNNLLAGIHPAIPAGTSLDQAPQLADLNGDGLTDVVYFRDGGIVARIMERTGDSFSWGGARPLVFSQDFDPCAGLDGNCRWEVAGLYRKNNYQQLNDFNGDARADLLLVADVTRDGECATTPDPGDPLPPVEPRSGDRYSPASPVCVVPWVHALTVEGVQPGAVELAPYPNGRWNNAYFDAVSFVDVNGDGLTDILNHNEAVFRPIFQLNLGSGFDPDIRPVLDGFGAIWSPQMQVSDVNGDGLADVVYPFQQESAPHRGFDRFVMRKGRPDGSFGAEEPIPGGLSTACSDKECMLTRSYLLGDYDSDGGLDFVRIEWHGADAEVFVARAEAGSRGRPFDVITHISNGLGAITELTYLPLTNKAVYRAEAGSRDAMQVGRGSPVRDVRAPSYVVARASSSAPVQGDPDAMASVHYRYVGARMQAGGRGMLGFSEIHSIEANHAHQYVLSKTYYHQDFPFIGRPFATEKRVVSGRYREDDCFADVGDACFVELATPFEAFNGKVVYLSTSYSAWDSPNFVPGMQQPVRVRLAASTDVDYDPKSGDVLSRVDNEFRYDAWDNAVRTVTRTYATDFGSGTPPAAVSTVLTESLYDNDGAHWRLGRLRTSMVTHQRPGQPEIVRSTDFEYDTGAANTGLLTVEQVQQGAGDSQDLRTFHVLDAFGNRVRTHTCSADLTEVQCKRTAIDFHPADSYAVQRYTRQTYDNRGRFVVSTQEPFRGDGPAVEHATSTVLARNAFGDVTFARDVNGVQSVAVYGTLGRPYMQWRQTSLDDPAGGVQTRTVFRWCGAGHGEVDCPQGARYREETTTTGAPTTWTYFDRLARPVLRVGAGFNAGVEGMEFSAVCSTYDARGRATGQSIPFFLAEPAHDGGPAFGGQDPCAAGYWTTTRYDVLDRPTTITAPDGSTNSFRYAGRLTEFTDALGHTRSEETNALGERMRATDAGGLVTEYIYDSAGNLASVVRDGGRGTITTAMQYDALGRKIAMQDPDAGDWTYHYNALGELIEQRAAAGARITQRFDARGRVYSKETAAGPVTETIQTFVHDTADHGLGQLASESISGSYAAWDGQHALAHDFTRSHAYDALGRPTATTTTISGVAHTSQTTYDRLGRPFKQQDASGRWLKTHYDERGFARALCESSATDDDLVCTSGDSDTYLETLETDARGNVVWERRGGSHAMDVERLYDARTGRLEWLCAGTSCVIQEELYKWDQAGNLEWRDKVGQYREAFTYDPLHRLTEARYERILGETWDQGSGPVSLAVTHDRLGNLCSKTIEGQVQAYTYAGAAGCGQSGLPGSGGHTSIQSPHAVTAVGDTTFSHDDYGNQTLADADGTARDRSIRYTAEQQAHEIAMGTPTAPTQRARFWYAPGGQRYLREDYAPDNRLKRTLYLGNVELIQQGGVVTFKRYVAGVLVQEIGGNTPGDSYLFTDHLGSVVRVTDGAGNVLEGMDYGAFGERRGYENPRDTALVPQATNRGFTGHEMLDGLDVVHMNGRIYDSRIARFLQPDPIIQEPGNPQNFNRYTYLWNNPLNGTDPTGYLGMAERQWIGVIITVIAVATQNYWAADFAAATATGSTALVYAGVGAVSGGISTQSWSGAAWGAFSGLAFSGLGSGLKEANGLMRGVVMGSTGGVLSLMQGGKFGHGFVSAGVGAALGKGISKIGNSYGRATIAALVGGSVSAATGGKFANGAATAAVSSSLQSVLKAATRGSALERWMAQQTAYNVETALAWQPPSLPQGFVDFVAGYGDALSLGLTQYVREVNDIGSVNYDSAAYTAGEISGFVHSTALGGMAGIRAAGTARRGFEFSHWIPNRWNGPRSLYNGNYVTAVQHALSDPYRYRFMRRTWKAVNPMPPVAIQQWNRVPWVWKGIGAGASYGGIGVAAAGGGN